MKRFLFLFFATLFALTTWAYSVTDDSTGTTIYYNTVDDGLEVTYGGMMYGSTTSYCVDEVIIPEYVSGTPVVGIGADAFDYCTLKAVSLPSTLQYIRDSGFYECGNLKEIDIPEGVTVIESSAFYHCYALTTVKLPSTLTEIGSGAFRSDTALSDITCLATTPPSCAGAFNGVTTSGVNLYVPSESVSDYEAHEVWKGFNVQAIDDGGDTGGSYTIVFSPTNGGTETLPESGLKEFVISCEDGISMSGTGTSRTWSLNDGTSGVSITKNAPSDDGKSLTLTLAQTITTAGTYSFGYSQRGTFNNTIPAGTFLLGPNGEVESEEMSYSFTLVEEESGSDDPYTVEPDEDVVQQSLSYVKFIAEGAICWSEDVAVSEVKVYKDEVEVASGASVVDDMPSTGTWDDAVNIYFDTTIVEAGDYKVVVPAGFMNLGSWTVYNDEITLYYTVDGSLDTGGGTGDDGDHEGDYLTPEIMGLDASNTGNQDFTYTGPSGTVYAGNARYISSGDYDGCINFYATNGYLKNTSSVGNLRKVIFEENGNDGGSTAILYVRASDQPWDGNNFTSYGTEVAQVPVSTGGEFTIEGDYAYFACYGGSSLTAYRFKSIEVVWSTGSGDDSGSDHEYSIFPVEGEVSSLQVFTLSTPNGVCANDEYYSSEYDGTVYLYKDGDSEPCASTSNIEGNMDWDVTWNGDYELVFTFDSEITEAGSYEFVIPAGIFIWMSEDGDILAVNDEMRFTYIVDGSEANAGGSGGTVGENGGDYLTAENMGLTAGATSNETISFTGPSGTEYEVNARWISGGDYDGNVNFYVNGYLKNTSSVGTLSKVIFEANGNDTGSNTIFYVRASNEPWDGTNFDSYGTEVAQVPVSTGGEFTIEGDYAYFACYGGSSLTSYRFKSVEVVWNIAGDDEEGAIPAGYILDPAHESYVETLSTISIYPESGSLSLNDYNAVGVVMSKTGGQVGTVTFSDDYDDELQMGWCIATLSEEISDMGTYYVTFPAGVFYNFGEGATNPEFTATYYVTGSADEGEYSFAPADGSTLTSLESFDVCHSISICCAWDQTLLITVEDENGNTVAYGDDCVDNWPDSWDDPCLSCTIILNTKIVVAGMYTISIPAGYFVVGENDLLSEALTINYIVDGSEGPGTGTGIGGISINDENVEGIYSTSGQKLNKAQKGVNIIRYTDGSVKKLYVK